MNILPMVMSAASLFLCVFMFFYFRRWLRKNRSEDALKRYQDETNRLIARIDSVTEQDTRVVEDQIARLQAVLEDVRKRTELYVKEVDRRAEGERRYRELGILQGSPLQPPLQPQPLQSEDASPAPPAGAVPPARGFGITLKMEGRLPAGTAPAAAQSEPPAPREPAPDERSVADRVTELGRQGFSAREIADRLGISVSEAEFTLDLRG